MRGYQSPFENIIARSVAPATYPVELAEVKDHLQVDDSNEDTLIQALIAAATEYFDGPSGVLGKALITQTYQLSVPCAKSGAIKLPVTPVQSVSSMTYYDTDDASQSLTVGDFRLYKNEDWAVLEPKAGVTWPTTISRDDAITITFVAGFGDAASVPQIIKQAILMTIRHWFDNRSATSDLTIKEVPFAVQSIINMHKVGWVA